MDNNSKNYVCTVKSTDSPNSPVWCKNQAYVSYGSRVITNFVFKQQRLATVATRVGLGVSLIDTVRLADPENPYNRLLVGLSAPVHES